MSKKITLLVDNIITPYEVARYNAINDVLNKSLEIWFQAEKTKNRQWKYMPKMNFSHLTLSSKTISFGRKDSHFLHLDISLYQRLLKKKKDLKEVILCGWDSPNYWIAAFFCIRNRIPFRLWSGSTAYEQSWRRKLFLPIMRWLVGSAKQYIAYGTRASQFLTSLGAPRDRIQIFLNSVDVDFFEKSSIKLQPLKKMLRKKYGFEENDFIFVYVGQFIDRKGIDLLLSVFQMPQITSKLLLVGSGPLYEKIHKVSKTNQNIRVISHTEHDQLPEIYAISNCHILPSLEEVWGLVINEALASGIPVIASSATGASEDLIQEGETGYIFNSRDKDDLARAINLAQRHQFKKEDIRKSIRNTDPRIQAKKVFGDKNA